MRVGPLLDRVCLLLLIALIGAIPGLGQPSSVNTTVCSIVSRPQKFNKRLVRLRARVNSDGIERTVLVSDKCADKGIALIVPPEAAQSTGALTLHRAIFQGRPGTTDKRIDATFLGMFLWSPADVPSRILQVREITEVQVSSLNKRP